MLTKKTWYSPEAILQPLNQKSNCHKKTCNKRKKKITEGQCKKCKWRNSDEKSCVSYSVKCMGEMKKCTACFLHRTLHNDILTDDITKIFFFQNVSEDVTFRIISTFRVILPGKETNKC